MWYFVAATLDAETGRATLYQEGVANRYNGLLSKVTPHRLSFACVGSLSFPAESICPKRRSLWRARATGTISAATSSRRCFAARSIGPSVYESRAEP